MYTSVFSCENNARIEQIVKGSLEKPDCKKCGLGTACCGCSAMRQYTARKQDAIEALGADIVTAAEELALHYAKRSELRKALAKVEIDFDKAAAELRRAYNIVQK